MKHATTFSLIAVSTLMLLPLASSFSAAHAAEWGYCCGVGPEAWATLDPGYARCASGDRQTPIDVSSTDAADDDDLPRLRFVYAQHAELELVHNGHTVEAEVEPGDGMLFIGRQRFDLLQFHYHVRSENWIDGRDFPIEFHFVHRSSAGELAVVGVFGEAGAADEDLEEFVAHLPTVEGEHASIEGFDLEGLFPAARTTYRFSGSLTTPPCSEGVRWHLFTETSDLSSEQLATLTAPFSGSHFPDGNRRPLQQLNNRQIVTDLDD